MSLFSVQQGIREAGSFPPASDDHAPLAGLPLLLLHFGSVDTQITEFQAAAYFPGLIPCSGEPTSKSQPAYLVAVFLRNRRSHSGPVRSGVDLQKLD